MDENNNTDLDYETLKKAVEEAETQGKKTAFDTKNRKFFVSFMKNDG